MKDAIMRAHNKLRNEISGGGVLKYESASNMATIQWDEGLEDVAKHGVRKCDFEHNTCVRTGNFTLQFQIECFKNRLEIEFISEKYDGIGENLAFYSHLADEKLNKSAAMMEFLAGEWYQGNEMKWFENYGGMERIKILPPDNYAENKYADLIFLLFLKN